MDKKENQPRIQENQSFVLKKIHWRDIDSRTLDK